MSFESTDFPLRIRVTFNSLTFPLCFVLFISVVSAVIIPQF